MHENRTIALAKLVSSALHRGSTAALTLGKLLKLQVMPQFPHQVGMRLE